MLRGIASGMEYLSGMNYVHRVSVLLMKLLLAVKHKGGRLFKWWQMVCRHDDRETNYICAHLFSLSQLNVRCLSILLLHRCSCSEFVKWAIEYGCWMSSPSVGYFTNSKCTHNRESTSALKLSNWRQLLCKQLNWNTVYQLSTTNWMLILSTSEEATLEL